MSGIKSITYHIFAILILVLASCGGGASNLDTTGSAAPDPEKEDVVGGALSEINITSGQSEVTFTDLSDDEDIIIFLFSFNETSGSSGFQIGSSENVAFLLDVPLDEEQDGDPTSDLHSHLRFYETFLDPSEALNDDEPVSRYAVKYQKVGDEKTFKVLNSFSSSTSYDLVTATLRVDYPEFQFYVDNRNTNALSGSELLELAIQFDAVLALERRLFGFESDVDGDGKFKILFTQTVNEMGAGLGGMVTGFFYAIDLFSSSTYPISNETEIVYTFIPDLNGLYGPAVSKEFAMVNIFPGVIAHEFQHMINFNMHYRENGGSAETAFLNEGMSHIAEDIYSANSQDYMTKTGLENPARVSSYLANVSSYCFTCGTSLPLRGGIYLFIRYLYEQAELGHLSGVSNGADLLGKLVDTGLRGIDNITNAVFGSTGTDEDYQEILGLFGLAVYLSNTGATTDDRLGFLGINLRGPQNDNRGTVLNGPSIQTVTSFPFTDALSGNSITYMQVSGSTINAEGGRIEFTFGMSSDFGGYIIRE